MTDNIHQLNPTNPGAEYSGGRGSGDGGGSLGERVARVEESIKSLATKEDIGKVKIWVLSGVIANFVVAAGLVLAVLTFLK